MTVYPSVYLAIDPGSKKSGWVLALIPFAPDLKDLHGRSARLPEVVECGVSTNDEVLHRIAASREVYRRALYRVAIERFAFSGGNAGMETFDACHWGGRMAQTAVRFGADVYRPFRRDAIIAAVGKAVRGKTDSAVITGICQLYGGDRSKVVGTKKAPGPLYGFKSHIWAAMAVLLAAAYYGAGAPEED